jgi:predicted lipoprotein with Yx(FWY)xxD motif
MMESVEQIFADTKTAMSALKSAIETAQLAMLSAKESMDSAKTAFDGIMVDEGVDLNG